jgi:5-dehydro-2-deoxygluconokinase
MDDRAFDVLCIGRSSIDLYAHEIGAAITDVRSFDAYVGGCPTNVAVGTRRLGLRAALLTAVGDDQVGTFILDFLRREQVETRYIPCKAGRRSSAVILTIQPPDRFPLTFYREHCADIALSIDDVLAAPLQQSRIVFISGTGVSRDPSRSATFLAAEEARAAGAQVILDIDERADQWDDPRAFGPTVRALARLATLAVGTEQEVRAAGGSDDLDLAIERILDCGVAALVLKRGERGATIIRRGQPRCDIAPFPVTVLNVLGAGDAFASGLIAGMLAGWSLERAARMGCATGAIVVTRHGCANFMPTRSEVEAFVAEHGGW